MLEQNHKKSKYFHSFRLEKCTHKEINMLDMLYVWLRPSIIHIKAKETQLDTFSLPSRVLYASVVDYNVATKTFWSRSPNRCLPDTLSVGQNYRLSECPWGPERVSICRIKRIFCRIDEGTRKRGEQTPHNHMINSQVWANEDHSQQEYIMKNDEVGVTSVPSTIWNIAIITPCCRVASK